MGGKTAALLRNKNYLLLLVIVFFMHLAAYLVIPVFPVFLQKARSLTIGQVGLILGVGSVAYQAGSLSGGLLSDRFGRRTVMVAGSLIQSLAMVGYHYSQAYWLFLFFSGINGVGIGLLAPTIKAKIADLVERSQRTSAFSWRGIFAHFGIIVAGITITLLTARQMQPFLFSAVVFFVLAAVTQFLLPYDRCVGEECETTPMRDYLQILRHRSFMLFAGITLLIWAFYAQFALVLPLRGEYVLHSATLIGLIWTINSISVVLLQGALSRFVLERINPYLSLTAGTALLGAGLFSMGWAEHFYSLSASAILFILGEMLFMPVLDSLVGHFAKEQWLGAYFGIANFVSGIGTAIGTSVGGSLVETLGGVSSRAPWIAYGLTAVFLAAVLGLFASYAIPRHQREVRTEVAAPGKKEGAR
jgi:MFS family permease